MKYLVLLLLLVSSPVWAVEVPDLNSNSSPSTSDLLYTVDVSDTTDGATGTGKKATISQVMGVGNALTATSLQANGANCAAGEYPLGVDASGAVESCTTAGTGGGFTDGGTNVYLTTSTDNVGIGTLAPSEKLEVIGSGKFTSVKTGSGTGSITATAGINFQSNSSDDSTVDVVLTTSGNLGIATSPTVRLHVAGAGIFTGLVTGLGGGDFSNGIMTLGTVAGAVDGGGATSLEIPNSASPTVNVAGETAIDTSDDQMIYYGAAQRVLRYEWVRALTFPDIATSDDDVPLLADPDAITITGIRCQTPAGTTVGITINDGTNSMEEVVCDSDGQTDDGSLTNNTFTANEMMYFDTGTVTGTITWTNLTIRGTVDAQ